RHHLLAALLELEGQLDARAGLERGRQVQQHDVEAAGLEDDLAAGGDDDPVDRAHLHHPAARAAAVPGIALRAAVVHATVVHATVLPAVAAVLHGDGLVQLGPGRDRGVDLDADQGVVGVAVVGDAQVDGAGVRGPRRRPGPGVGHLQPGRHVAGGVGRGVGVAAPV